MSMRYTGILYPVCLCLWLLELNEILNMNHLYYDYEYDSCMTSATNRLLL
jgi:hypothetical protein